MTGNGDAPAEPIRGRFKLTPVEPSGAILGWATGLCDRCLNCTCGTQREPLDLTPGGAMKTFLKLKAYQKNGMPNG
jgi:hypothetical protein